MNQRYAIRERQYKSTYNKYQLLFGEFQQKYPMVKDSISLKDIYSFQQECVHNQEECSEMINNLPILYWPQEKKLKLKKDKNLSKDYLDSLIWTSHYYFKECIHWKWATEYTDTPTLKDLSEYINPLNEFSFSKEDQEYNLKELLSFIFPNESHKLHSQNIQSKKYQLSIEPYYCRYLWECDIKFLL